MAKKKINLNLKDKTIAELNKMLEEARKDWVDLKMQLSIGKLKNVHEPKQKRKLIANIKTIIREKQLKEQVK
jgi:large subunit ribosomal protein L29